MLIKETLYALDDVTIIPAPQSRVRHRSDIKVTYDNGYLPIFTAPMDTVVGASNMKVFEKNNIIPIMPRTESIETRLEWYKNGYWIAVGLTEFEEYWLHVTKFPLPNKPETVVKVLIDQANGHMDILPGYIKKAKKHAEKYNVTLEIMIGNIANPIAYKILAEAGADYIRCGIGGGQCCITTSNSSNHMPMASLLDECRQYKNILKTKCKIIADGGISNFSRAITALALGADYVMMGSLLGSLFESAAELQYEPADTDDITYNNMKHDDLTCDICHTMLEEEKKEFIATYHPTKIIYGMSTRKAQKKINPNAKLKTSEGIERRVNVEYTLAQWVDNFKSFLRTAMSYDDFVDIKDYIGAPTLKLLSESAKASINK